MATRAVAANQREFPANAAEEEQNIGKIARRHHVCSRSAFKQPASWFPAGVSRVGGVPTPPVDAEQDRT